jgi:hypothetical protein
VAPESRRRETRALSRALPAGRAGHGPRAGRESPEPPGGADALPLADGTAPPRSAVALVVVPERRPCDRRGASGPENAQLAPPSSRPGAAYPPHRARPTSWRSQARSESRHAGRPASSPSESRARTTTAFPAGRDPPSPAAPARGWAAPPRAPPEAEPVGPEAVAIRARARAAPRVPAEDWGHSATGAGRVGRRRYRCRRPESRDERTTWRARPLRKAPDPQSSHPRPRRRPCGREASRDG